MNYQLSLLDKSPIAKGETATDALQRTLKLAQAAERLGYHRFWVAEHHDTADLKSPEPPGADKAKRPHVCAAFC